MRLLLGVDGGNSKTLAAVMDETGTVLGIGRAGPGNHQSAGLESALEQIGLAAARALDRAGRMPSDVDAVYYTLAGADLPEDFDLLLPPLRALEFGRTMGLNNDSIGALRSGTDNLNAVVVVMGAGMNAAGRNAAGQNIRLHALGWISGDVTAGGGQIARDAVRLAVRGWDGRGESTLLTEIVPPLFGADTIEAMIRTLYFKQVWYEEGEGKPILLNVVPHVFAAANAGDEVARALVRSTAEEAVTTAQALMRRLDLLDTPSDVVLAGGIFRGEGTLLIDSVRAGLGNVAPKARIILPDVEPVVGTLLCCTDLLEIPVDTEIRRRVAESYPVLEVVVQ